MIVDVDGVLLDIYTQMTHMFADMNIRFDINDAYTYDFNKNLPKMPKFNKLPPRKLIYELFENPELFKNSSADLKSVELLRKSAEQGVNILIYTVSINNGIYAEKQNLFEKWFKSEPNISFKSVTNESDKIGLATKTVIEDSHINLQKYDENTAKYLVNKPYNQLVYNNEYMDVFSDKNFYRCRDTFSAITEAITYINLTK